MAEVTFGKIKKTSHIMWGYDVLPLWYIKLKLMLCKGLNFQNMIVIPDFIYHDQDEKTRL